MSRIEYPARHILLSHERLKQVAIAAIQAAPIDSKSPIQFVLREEPKVRKLSANDRMWAGPLRDIAKQAYVHGRTYSAEIWHEHFKREFLPEEFDEALCKEGYRKWDIGPGGDRVLVGSTTQLTRKGFAQYLTQVEAYAASELGVLLSAGPRDA